MTHLKIEQNNSAIEEVSSAVITKLYELATSGELDQDSNLVGRLHTDATYQEYIDAIRAEYSELYISSDKYYLYMGDPTFTQIMATRYGDGTGCVLSDISTVTDALEDAWGGFSGNTNITDATGLKYFTHLNFSNSHPQYYNGFKDCTNLKRCELPEGMLVLSSGSGYNGTGFFRNCTNLEYVSLPSTMQKIETNSFEGCTHLTNITIPSAVTIIEGSAFVSTGLTSITLPSGLTSLGGCVFGFSQLTSIHIPSSVTVINGELCLGCPLTSITFDQSTGSSLTINTGQIYGSGFLASMAYPIPTTLTTIDFPARLSSIGQHPFRGLSSLTTLIFRGTTPPTSNGDGLDVPSGCTIYVPDAAVTTYQQDTWFSPHSSKIQPLSSYTPSSS